MTACMLKIHLLDTYHWCNWPLYHLLCMRLGVMRGGSNRNCLQEFLQPFPSSCKGFSIWVSGVLGQYLGWDLDSLLSMRSEVHASLSTVTGSEIFVPYCSLFATVIFPPLGWVFSHLPGVALQWLFLGESCLVCAAACPRLVSFLNSLLGSSVPRFLRDGRYRTDCGTERDRTPGEITQWFSVNSVWGMGNHCFLGDTGYQH